MDDRLLIERRAVEPFLKNGYLLVCAQTGKAAYIDPGDESGMLLEWLNAQGFQLVSILNTHAHLDHICGILAVKRQWDVPIYLHPEDEPLYHALPEQAQWFGLRYEPAPEVDVHLQEGETVQVGELQLAVYHTPGHSPGSVCLHVGSQLFCGDLLFAGSVGRTDLPGGSHDILIRSIREKVLPLGDEVVLHPGHGPETTIGRERTSNPFLVGSPYLND